MLIKQVKPSCHLINSTNITLVLTDVFQLWLWIWCPAHIYKHLNTAGDQTSKEDVMTCLAMGRHAHLLRYGITWLIG